MILRHLLAILALPVTVTLLVPLWIMSSGGSASGPWAIPTPVRAVTIVLGAGSIGLGLTLVVVTIRYFAAIGRGTLAPWDPTQELVVYGAYRYVRNPMISGVVFVLFGEALLLASTGLLLWALAAFAINALYIPLIEERGLRKRFGAQYEEYCRNVPRWLPRRSPWTPSRPANGNAQAPI